MLRDQDIIKCYGKLFFLKVGKFSEYTVLSSSGTSSDLVENMSKHSFSAWQFWKWLFTVRYEKTISHGKENWVDWRGWKAMGWWASSQANTRTLSSFLYIGLVNNIWTCLDHSTNNNLEHLLQGYGNRRRHKHQTWVSILNSAFICKT